MRSAQGRQLRLQCGGGSHWRDHNCQALRAPGIRAGSMGDRWGQLRMCLGSLAGLPEPQVPPGLVLRTFRSDDEAGWAQLMTGAIGDWDVQSTRREFLGDLGVDPDGIFFLVMGGEYVATATDKRTADAATGYLQHMVAVSAAHRGRRLGRCVSLAALRHMRQRGCQRAVLDTDDDRLPAIRTYLALGFVPHMVEDDHPARWQRVMSHLEHAASR